MLVSDNCTTAVNHKKSDWYNTALNTTYHEMAEHYNLAILPAKVRKPKDKCFLSSTFPEKKRQNSLFLARDFPCFRQDVLCILTHEGMFHPVSFSLKDQ